MRVALPAWRLLSPRGGVGNTLYHLLAQYAEVAADDRFIVYHDAPDPDLPAAANAEPRLLRLPLQNAATWNHVAVPLAAARDRVDLLHNVSYVLPWYTPVPAVVTVHDVSYARHPEWFSAKGGAFLRSGTAIAVKRAAAIVTDSQFSAGEIAGLYGTARERIDVVPLAADPRFGPVDPGEVRQRYDLPERFVFYLGGVHERRRFVELVQVCGRVLPAQDAWLVVAGPGGAGEPEAQRAVSAAGLEPRVRWLGYVPDDDLPGLYSACTCFAWPSIYEGFGLPPLEAMACGAPTLVADASSLPEVVGDAAVRVPPDDSEALADALARLLTDDALRATLASAGMARAATFSWRATAEAMLGIYRRVLEERR